MKHRKFFFFTYVHYFRKKDSDGPSRLKKIVHLNNMHAFLYKVALKLSLFLIKVIAAITTVGEVGTLFGSFLVQGLGVGYLSTVAET